MRLALFDLDHTLIPFDSGMEWTHFLVTRGVLPPEADARYLDHCRQYVAGTLDIHAMHRAGVLPLSRFARREVDAWLREFETEMAARVDAPMRELVDEHRRQGDLCAIVTATTRFIAEPFARLYGVNHLLATEAARQGDGDGAAWTGEIAGDPCFREHKPVHVVRWLERLGHRLGDFERSTFYSDSASDLPLLQAVSNPVAVRPDARLRAIATQRRWRIVGEGSRGASDLQTSNRPP